MATVAPPKAPPKAPPRQAASSQTAAGNISSPAVPTARKIIRGGQAIGQKIGIYGPGGIGKSKLWSLAELVGVTPLGIDIEGSCNFLNVPLVQPTPQNWDELRAVLHDFDLLKQVGMIAIDSFTKAEEFALEWTLSHVPHEKGHFVSSIEGYGFGKGTTHLYETFLQLLGDLDAVARAGIHVVFVCHDCTAPVPNPAGEDYIRWEPRLQSPASGKSSIRHRVKEWCDHLFFVGYDTWVKEGKATGAGTRTIYPVELPTHWAKSRLLSSPIVYKDNDPTLWKLLFGKE